MRLHGAISGAQAQRLIRKGEAPTDLHVVGHLDLSRWTHAPRLPAGLRANSLDLSECPHVIELPPALHVDHLILNACRALTALPQRLRCDVLEARATSIRSLPEDLNVRFTLDLRDCVQLETLPRRLQVQTLLLARCASLVTLPDDLDVCHLDMSGCTALTAWHEPLQAHIDRLSLRDCTALDELPANLGPLLELDVSGCNQLRQLPNGLSVTGWLDVTDSPITALPDSLLGVRLRSARRGLS
jgi:hypothetical protein